MSFSSPTNQNLVKEVLYELLLEWPRSKQAVKIGAKELSDEVTVCCVSKSSACTILDFYTYISSSGEMKISLRLMT